MNTSQKCNCCAAENVCKFKEAYQKAVEAILQTEVDSTYPGVIIGGPVKVRSAGFIEVDIKCPNMITRSTVRNSPYTLGDSITAEDFMQRYGSGGSSTKAINCNGDACAVDLR